MDAPTTSAQAVIPPGPGPLILDPPVQHNLTLKVKHIETAPKTVLRLHKRAAEVLTDARLGVPDYRAAYFSRMSDLQRNPVTGWSAKVIDVEQVDAGFLVTLQVKAKRGRMLDNAHVMEQYVVNGKDVAFVGFFDPPPYVHFKGM